MLSNWFNRSKPVKQVDFDGLKKAIDQWSLDRAAKFVGDVLQDETKYKTIANSSGNATGVREMPNPSASAFFAMYEGCSQVYGDVSISLSDVGQSEYRSEYIRVARGIDATEIVAKSGSDEVYEVDGSDDDFSETPFPSIFHWLAFSSCVVYQELAVQVIEQSLDGDGD